MKLALFDDTLAPESGAVRSATEIAERVSKLSQNWTGVFGRLTLEVVVVLVRRYADIAERIGYFNDLTINIDQLLTQVRVVSPISRGQYAAKLEAHTRWLEMMAMLYGPQAAAIVGRVEMLAPDMGRWLGVEEKYIRSPQEIRDNFQAMMAAQQAQQQAEAQPPAEPPSPTAQYVNGGAP